MRLWTIHPKYLDARGLVALWREALLAQKVLRGQTIGYRHHPQLERFRSQKSPVGCIADYLTSVYKESRARGYQFDRTKVGRAVRTAVVETEGQLLYEWAHFKRKLHTRNAGLYKQVQGIKIPDPHPMFRIVPGGIRPWERGGKQAV